MNLHQIRFAMVCLVDCQKWLNDGGNTLKKRKSCPNIGVHFWLCEAGEIDGVNNGDYMRSRLGRKKNKKYAIEAVKLLRSCPCLASDKKELWERAKENTCAVETLRHNNQLDVVLALFEAGLIR